MSQELLAKLSQRERECLIQVLKGKTAKETGKSLHLSFRTVEDHIASLKEKLGCTHKRELHALFPHQLIIN